MLNSKLPLNPVLKHLPTYQPGRPIEEVARDVGLSPADIIKLASNENPLGPSPGALQAMQQALANLHLYPDGNAFYLKQRLATNLGLRPAHLILGNGSNEIIEFIGHALMQPGADVVVSQYCFAIYPLVAKLFGANLITVPARKYGHDLSAMLKAITPQTRVVFVANPNNPTGTMVSQADLARFAKDVPAGVLLVIDEAYFEFTDDPTDFIPEIRQGIKLNLLLMRTFSKIHGLAGLRLGYGIGNPDLIASLEKVRQPFNINSIAQAGALAALDDPDHIRRTRENNTQGLKFYEKALRKLRLKYIPSVANFVLVRVDEGHHVAVEMEKQGVIVRPMDGYQLPEWIRISIGTPTQNARCIAVLKSVLES